MPNRSALSISSAQLGRIVEDSVSEVFLFDPETFEFLLVNRGARENLGYSVEELAHLTPWDLKPFISEDQFRKLVAPMLAGEGDDLKFETVHRRKDGSDYDVSVHLQLLHDDENRVFFAAIRDITDEKRLSAELEHKTVLLEEAIAAKDVLLHEVNHRVKNSLQVVMSLLQMHARQAKDGELAAALNEASNRVAIVATIHQNLYSTSQHTIVNFSEVIDQLAGQVVGHMDLGGKILVEKDIENGVEIGLDTAIPLSLITSEILSNCAKYAFPGARGGKISISLNRGAEKIRCRISDDGVGMPEPFESIANPGLGTRIIKSLARQIRASLEVSTDARGTEFLIELPLPDKSG